MAMPNNLNETEKKEESLKEKEILKLVLGMLKGKSPEAISAIINLIGSSSVLLQEDKENLIQEAKAIEEKAKSEEKTKLGAVKELENLESTVTPEQKAYTEYIKEAQEKFNTSNEYLSNFHKEQMGGFEECFEEYQSKGKISIEKIKKVNQNIISFNEEGSQAYDEHIVDFIKGHRATNIDLAWRIPDQEKIELEAKELGVKLNVQQKNLPKPIEIRKNQLEARWNKNDQAIKDGHIILKEVVKRVDEIDVEVGKISGLVKLYEEQGVEDKYINMLNQLKTKNMEDVNLIVSKTSNISKEAVQKFGPEIIPKSTHYVPSREEKGNKKQDELKSTQGSLSFTSSKDEKKSKTMDAKSSEDLNIVKQNIQNLKKKQKTKVTEPQFKKPEVVKKSSRKM